MKSEDAQKLQDLLWSGARQSLLEVAARYDSGYALTTYNANGDVGVVNGSRECVVVLAGGIDYDTGWAGSDDFGGPYISARGVGPFLDRLAVLRDRLGPRSLFLLPSSFMVLVDSYPDGHWSYGLHLAWLRDLPRNVPVRTTAEAARKPRRISND